MQRRNNDRKGGHGGGFKKHSGPRKFHSGGARSHDRHSSRPMRREYAPEERGPVSTTIEQVRKFPAYERKSDRRNIYTKNLTPGRAFFAEQLVTQDGVEYRSLDVSRSKLGAGIKKDLSQIGIKEGDVVLYLGASHGFTPSFVSDMVGPNGFVFCLDVAPRVVRDLVFVCEARENMAPILADANQPDTYKDLITPQVDIIFQDISQRNQVEIFQKNCEKYLKSGGFGLLAVKARSIDVTMRPRDIFMRVRHELGDHAMVVDYKELDPFERDHALFVIKKK
jgi:fibrillarin-like pre-rRNA processing protein